MHENINKNDEMYPDPDKKRRESFQEKLENFKARLESRKEGMKEKIKEAHSDPGEREEDKWFK